MILIKGCGIAAVVLTLPLGGCAARTSRAEVSPPQSTQEQPAPPVETKSPEPTPAQPTEASTGTSPKTSTTTPTTSTGATEAPTETHQAPGTAAPTTTGNTKAPTQATSAPATKTPAPKPPRTAAAPSVKKAPAPTPSSAPAPAAASSGSRPATAAPAPLDLVALKDQLKATPAIGVFTKISLKNQVDDLLKKFGDYYDGKNKTTLPELRRSYDLLIMKVVSLLQDSDMKLASEVVSSREAIWALLSDRKKFATLPT